MSYEVKKTLLGKFVVNHACGHCQTTLESPLSDAGQTIACPACGNPHEVPGVAELKEVSLQKSREAAELAAKKAAAEEKKKLDALLRADQKATDAAHKEREAAVIQQYREERREKVYASSSAKEQHLAKIRAETRYGIARTVLFVAACLGVIGCAIFVLIAFRTGGLGGIIAAVPSCIGIVVIIAAYQLAIIPIDIADTLIDAHAKPQDGAQ